MRQNLYPPASHRERSARYHVAVNPGDRQPQRRTTTRDGIRVGFFLAMIVLTVMSNTRNALVGWAIVILVPALFIVWTVREFQKYPARLRAARLRRGLCPNCCYDLRASPQRCPECGTVISQKEAARIK